MKDEQDGMVLFKRFNEVVNRFLYIGLDYLGSVPNDPVLRKANQLQRLIVRHDPASESARALRQLSLQIERTSRQYEGNGGMQMFWDQVAGFA